MDDYLRCDECKKSDHEGQFCRCETRNIRVAKEKRSKGESPWVTSQPERSKREDLINSDEYKNASEIQKTEFRIAYNLKRLLNLD